MPAYKAPMRDMQFVMHELLNVCDQYQSLLGHDELNRELLDAIFEEGAKFAEQELSPLNQTGDQEGCTFKDGEVTTPAGFKAAFKKYVEGGWPSIAGPADVGGQGLPESVAAVISEMVGTANWSFGMYPGLSHGAIHTIESHGTEEQKEVFLTKLIEGSWTGTMCLTEAHCGSDLGLLRTRAEPNEDGSYSITGTKIFISAGEHDLAENIVHIVLARLPDAPQGTKGISLFIVPKQNVAADGSISERNAVSCGSIEHKMGIKASATCVMNFEGAKGYLIGPPNRGLNCMFTFMNVARLYTGMQGVAAAEASFQGALEYARERLSMRALSGPKHPDKEADPIIVHPDVRRMLLTQKAFAEGGRAMILYLATLADRAKLAESEQTRKEADDLMSFLTPIGKAFLTEAGLEAANLGVQVYGGHGYIAEWGMEQILRDVRIATLYEGTTGIQALDLLGRKVLQTQGELLKKFTKIVHVFCKDHADDQAVAEFVRPLVALNKEWGELTTKIGMSAMQNPDEVGAAAFDYLMYSGYVCLAYFWVRMVKVAREELDQGSDEADFYKAKIETARFYFARILPRTKAHVAAIEGGLDSLMSLAEDQFSF